MKFSGIKITWLLLCLFFLFNKCSVEPQLSPMQKRQMTTRLVECSYENAYRATLTIIQDQGFIIKNTDMESGLIVAYVDRETSIGSQIAQALLFGFVSHKGTDIEVSCVVNRLNSKASEIRINIQEVEYGQNSFLSGTSKQGGKQIYKPELYYNLFNEIIVEIKRREAMDGIDSQDNDEIKVADIKRDNTPIKSAPSNIATTTSDLTNVYFLPTSESKLIAQVKRGTAIEILDEIAEWISVKFLSEDEQYNITGYIQKSCIQETQNVNKKVEVQIILINGTLITGFIQNETTFDITVKTSLGEIVIMKTNIKEIVKKLL